MNKIIYTLYTIILITVLSSCSKKSLEEPSSKSHVVPESISDLQALLDNTLTINYASPALSEVSADNYYLESNIWQSMSTTNRNAYIWAKDIYEGGGSNDWTTAYIQVLYANAALSELEKMKTDNTSAYNNVKGSALFIRSYAFFNVAQVFAKSYDKNDDNELGIPLRLTPDINEISVRSNVLETYQQILKDVKLSIHYLPPVSSYKTRPTKVSAYAFLSRIYMSMGDYNNALTYADSCLKIHSALIDFNQLMLANSYPLLRHNDEVLYHTATATFISESQYKVDTTLYNSYHENDLRKSAFFKPKATGGFAFRGSYDGSSILFSGIATDEIYLNQAECRARKDQKDLALESLNALLSKRFKTGTFNAITANNSEEALDTILAERRKELCFRFLRWSDLKRLNKEQKYATTLKRIINSQPYELPANDNRYALPIADNVIKLSGMQQNPR